MSSLTVVELKQICKDNGIVGYSKLKKEELLKLCKVKKTSKPSAKKKTSKASTKKTSKASTKKKTKVSTKKKTSKASTKKKTSKASTKKKTSKPSTKKKTSKLSTKKKTSKPSTKKKASTKKASKPVEKKASKSVEKKTSKPSTKKKASKPVEKKASKSVEKKTLKGKGRITGYILYSVDNRESVKDANDGIKFSEIGKELGRMWGELSDEEKAEWNAKARVQNDANGLDPTNPKTLTKKTTNKKHKGSKIIGDKAWKKSASKKASKKGSKGKGRITGFILYSVDNREGVKEDNVGIKFGEIGKELGRLWGELSDEDKEEWNAKARVQNEDNGIEPTKPKKNLTKVGKLRSKFKKMNVLQDVRKM